MSKFEFLDQNLINTTSMCIADSGSGTFSYLYDRNLALDYITTDYTGATSTTLNIVFSQPTVVSRVLLQNHNLKAFKIYYNSATANVFSPDCAVTANSSTNHYFAFNSTTVSSIQIQMDDVIATGERSIGELVISDCNTQFEVNPEADNYDPKLFKQKVKHIMPDGGTSLFVVDSKFQATIKMRYITTAFKDDLLALYNAGSAFYFVPEPTASAWLGQAHEVVWTNDWNFTFADNSKTQGWNGHVTIEETPGA